MTAAAAVASSPRVSVPRPDAGRVTIVAAELRAGIAHQTDPRDQIRDYLLRGVERGTVQDRAGVVAGPPTRRR